MQDVLEHLGHNTKAAASVAGGLIASGLGLLASVIPESIGKVAILVGIVLSGFLIRRARAEALKLELEIEVMREERDYMRERRANARRDDLSPFGRVVESLEVPPSSKPELD